MMKKTFFVLGMAGAASLQAVAGESKIEIAADSAFGMQDMASIIFVEGMMHCKCEENRFAGADLSYVYEFTPANSLNLRFGYAYGSQRWSIFDGDTERLRTSNISLLPGYRHDFHLAEPLSIYWGINAGVTLQTMRESYRGATTNTSPDSRSGRDTAWGYTGTTELGLRWTTESKAEIFVGGQVGFYTAENSIRYHNGQTKCDNVQFYVGVRGGVSIPF